MRPEGRKLVTTDTRFAVASTTTSMAAALEASYVGEGRLHGDQKVVDVWPGFRAPTDSLTRDRGSGICSGWRQG
jgi:CubicO group peptidase (beta-lactamase class C family)